LSYFHETPLLHLLKSKELPEWLNIVPDEAYTKLSVDCGYQILRPYSKHQLNTANKQDGQNLQDWTARITENLVCQLKNQLQHTGRCGHSTKNLAAKELLLKESLE
jgi:hypothetical protein